MSDDNKVLNLDELFGEARAVKVRWQEKEYELLRMEALGPRQANEFERLGQKAKNLQVQSEMSDDQAEKIDELFTAMIRMLCADFPVSDVPFMAKMRMVQFYVEQSQGKKAMEAAIAQVTGATSTAA
jgi:hypothetical protein